MADCRYIHAAASLAWHVAHAAARLASRRARRAAATYGSQNSAFIASVGQPFVRQREFRASQQRDSQAQQCGELLDAAQEYQDFLFELRRLSVRHVQADHCLRCHAEPGPGGSRFRRQASAFTIS